MKQITFLGIIFLSSQITTAQQKECESASFFSSEEPVTAPTFLKKIPSVASSLTELKKAAASAGYSFAKPLDFNDTETIRMKLNRAQGDGAAAITAESFDQEIARNIREAIHQISGRQPMAPNNTAKIVLTDPSITLEIRNGWDNWWERWPYDQLILTGKVSSSEMQRFTMQMNRLIQKIRDLIFKMDEEHIAAYTLSLRTETTRNKFLSDDHIHDDPDEWVSVNISALGLGSWIAKKGNDTKKKSITLPGQAWLLSETGRNLSWLNSQEGRSLELSEEKSKQLSVSAVHGTPKLPGERLFIVIIFKSIPATLAPIY